MRILTVVGARPQFVKAAVVSTAIDAHGVSRDTQIDEVLIHTGQHYDANMSDVFFRDLHMRPVTENLGVGSGTHGQQTGAMVAALEQTLLSHRPDLILLYGDTNSTLAGALAASKLHVPIAHVESGLRSFNRRMPEEVNRVITDHISTLCLCPTQTAVDNLAGEGIVDGVANVGDVMLDCTMQFALGDGDKAGVLDRLGLHAAGGMAEPYYLATVHRPENTDDSTRLASIVRGLSELGRPVVLPLHPRTRNKLESYGVELGGNIVSLEPVGYPEMVELEANARVILTDSGGVQKEAYFLGVPCVTMRDETEWVETVEVGWNIVVGASTERIIDATQALQVSTVGSVRPSIFGDGHAGAKVVDSLVSWYEESKRA